jgi:hypothetical protein
MADIPTVSVTARVRDQAGEPVSGAKVLAKLQTIERYNGYIVPRQSEADTDATGTAVLDVFPNELGSEGSEYLFKIITPTKTVCVYAVVPNSNCNLEEICDLDRYDLRGAGTILITSVIAEGDTQVSRIVDKGYEQSVRVTTEGDTQVVRVATEGSSQVALATEAKTGAIAARSGAEAAQGLAETAQGLAEDAQGLAETAQGLAEDAQGLAEEAQGFAEAAQLASEGARDAAIIAQGKAEDAQDLVEAYYNDFTIGGIA